MFIDISKMKQVLLYKPNQFFFSLTAQIAVFSAVYGGPRREPIANILSISLTVR